MPRVREGERGGRGPLRSGPRDGEVLPYEDPRAQMGSIHGCGYGGTDECLIDL